MLEKIWKDMYMVSSTTGLSDSTHLCYSLELDCGVVPVYPAVEPFLALQRILKQ